ncbi:MAG: transketolase [Candidatus Nomurabacteria bacterium]|jgi:transketolase|nr:transketolase [Candidatus Nomurabacteria bacterium]
MSEITRLEKHAASVRRGVLSMLATAGSGHTAGSLGLVEVVTAMYGAVLKFNPKNPHDSRRDLFMLSNGHVAPVLYATLAEFGLILKSELRTLRKLGTRLQGHPERTKLAWLETTSGPLGEGIGQAAGMALAIKRDGQALKRFVYVVTGDGELDEGNAWESIMFAADQRLGNLIMIVDRNGIQLSGDTENVMPLENLSEKIASFGWNVQEINGNSFEDILNAVKIAHDITDRPTAIIAHTTAGKGVEEIEGDWHWHGKAPSKEQEAKWLKVL